MEIGIDCLSIDRFAKIASSNGRFIKKCFTENEMRYCRSKADPSPHFAGRFAAKEAIIKAMSQYGIRLLYNNIEITNDDNGRPFAGFLKKDYSNYKIKISISHSENMAIATAYIDKE